MAPLPTVERWLRSRSFHHSVFPAERIAVERNATVSVCLLAADRSPLEPIVATLEGLVERGVADEILLLDTGMSEETAAVVPCAGRPLVAASSLLPAFGRVLGIGDALWRGLSVLTGDVVAFVHAGFEDFGEHVVCGLLGPVVCEPGARYATGFSRRAPLPDDRTVTELTFKPLLRRFWPELTGFHEPLARELAASRALLERLPFATGCGVQAGLLLDAHSHVGLRGLAQVDLDARPEACSPLTEQAARADEVVEAAARRVTERGVAGPRSVFALRAVERPPMASLRSAPVA